MARPTNPIRGKLRGGGLRWSRGRPARDDPRRVRPAGEATTIRSGCARGTTLASGATGRTQALRAAERGTIRSTRFRGADWATNCPSQARTGVARTVTGRTAATRGAFLVLDRTNAALPGSPQLTSGRPNAVRATAAVAAASRSTRASPDASRPTAVQILGADQGPIAGRHLTRKRRPTGVRHRSVAQRSLRRQREIGRAPCLTRYHRPAAGLRQPIRSGARHSILTGATTVATPSGHWVRRHRARWHRAPRHRARCQATDTRSARRRSARRHFGRAGACRPPTRPEQAGRRRRAAHETCRRRTQGH